MQIPLLHQQILLKTEQLRDMHRSIMLQMSPVRANEMENLLQEIRNFYNLALQLNNENALQLLNEVQLAVIQQLPVDSKTKIQPSEETLVVQTFKSSEKKHIVSDLHKMFQDAPSVAGKFSDHQTIAERIAENGSVKRVSDNLKTSVKDIKAAIGLNEKFQFINQLFNGDAKNYHSVIDELNVSSSFDMAMKYVHEISESNNWESHPASAKYFIEIIERRFSV